MRFVYVGNGDNDPQTIEAFGLRFELNGPPVAVRDKELIGKLSGNNHFKHVPSPHPPIGGTMAVQDVGTDGFCEPSDAPALETDQTLDANGDAWDKSVHRSPPRMNAKGLWARRPGRQSA